MEMVFRCWNMVKWAPFRKEFRQHITKAGVLLKLTRELGRGLVSIGAQIHPRTSGTHLTLSNGLGNPWSQWTSLRDSWCSLWPRPKPLSRGYTESPNPATLPASSCSAGWSAGKGWKAGKGEWDPQYLNWASCLTRFSCDSNFNTVFCADLLSAVATPERKGVALFLAWQISPTTSGNTVRKLEVFGNGMRPAADTKVRKKK